jgi:NTE family protein
MTAKRINLALQGGGAHGAFTWGVLDRILEDERIEIEGITATSAGTMNALCVASGLKQGGRGGAREMLARFWKKISESGEAYSPIRRLPGFDWPSPWGTLQDLSYQTFEAVTRAFSPYQFNPFDINPLRDILSEMIDFNELQNCKDVKLFISTTKVRTGRAYIFNNPELTLEVALASACLPFLFKSVEVEGEYYWDGGYMGNPALSPLIEHTASRDIIIVHINPLERDEIPTTSDAIMNRINEISFNASLLKDMRAIAFVHKLLENDWIKDEHRDKLRYMLVHSIRADNALREFSVMSKFDTSFNFLTYLRNKGRRVMDEWLGAHFDDLGERSSTELDDSFLNLGSEHAD